MANIESNNYIGRFGEMFKIIFVTKTILGDEKLSGDSFTVGNLSEVAILVLNLVVGEVGLEGRGDDDGAGGEGQAGHQKYCGFYHDIDMINIVIALNTLEWTPSSTPSSDRIDQIIPSLTWA